MVSRDAEGFPQRSAFSSINALRSEDSASRLTEHVCPTELELFKPHYEDCAIGDTVRTPGRTITEADVVAFAGFSGDWNSIHIDQEYARTTEFGQRIAHGMLGLVVGSCLLGRLGWFTFWPQSMLAITAIEKVRFAGPVFIGDTLHLEAEIVEMKPMSSDRGLITTRMKIKNQRDETAITLRVQLIAGRRPAGTAEGSLIVG